jgi:hypothetical protein
LAAFLSEQEDASGNERRNKLESQRGAEGKETGSARKSGANRLGRTGRVLLPGPFPFWLGIGVRLPSQKYGRWERLGGVFASIVPFFGTMGAPAEFPPSGRAGDVIRGKMRKFEAWNTCLSNDTTRLPPN